MSNKLALWLFMGLVAGAIVLGQAAHLSPTGRIRDGFRIMVTQMASLAFGGLAALWSWVYGSVWVMETAKNLFQAALLSGAGVVGFLVATTQEAERLATPATVGGFFVFGALMALVTRRAEQLRDRQAKADLAELVAKLAALLKKE